MTKSNTDTHRTQHSAIHCLMLFAIMLLAFGAEHVLNIQAHSDSAHSTLDQAY